jgi:hypothetical protein
MREKKKLGNVILVVETFWRRQSFLGDVLLCEVFWWWWEGKQTLSLFYSVGSPTANVPPCSRVFERSLPTYFR